MTLELEKLRAENEALRAKLPRWIPVSEGLPSTPCECLVATSYGDVFVAEWAKPRTASTYWFYEDLDSEEVKFVTHWMPLPDDPEQEPAP